MRIGNYLKAAVAAALLLESLATHAAATVSGGKSDSAEVSAVILAYQDAMNAADPEAAIRLYDDDGVLMPPGSPSIVGKQAIRKTYLTGAKIFTLHVKFAIAEAAKLGPRWAFARTTSAGTMKILATGETKKEANQELFLLHRQSDGRWKIARYGFSSMLPAT